MYCFKSSSSELGWESPLGESFLLWQLLVQLAGLALLPLLGVRLLFFAWTGVLREVLCWLASATAAMMSGISAVVRGRPSVALVVFVSFGFGAFLSLALFLVTSAGFFLEGAFLPVIVEASGEFLLFVDFFFCSIFFWSVISACCFVVPCYNTSQLHVPAHAPLFLLMPRCTLFGILIASVCCPIP